MPYQHHGLPGSLLDVALNFGVPLEHACGGNCACTTCHVIVRAGAENLSEMDDDEADRLDTAWDLTPQSRLACQAVVTRRRRVRGPGLHPELRAGRRRHPPGQGVSASPALSLVSR